MALRKPTCSVISDHFPESKNFILTRINEFRRTTTPRSDYTISIVKSNQCWCIANFWWDINITIVLDRSGWMKAPASRTRRFPILLKALRVVRALWISKDKNYIKKEMMRIFYRSVRDFYRCVHIDWFPSFNRFF